MKQPFIKRSDFAKDVLQYGIKEDDIDHLLQFLHTRIGQIRYFPVGDIKEIITKEPQALYNLVTDLITNTFLSPSVTVTQYSEVQRGIYSLDTFDVKEFSELLTPQQIIALLKELRIVAPFFDYKAKVEKYFIPCVLNHLKEPPVDDTCDMSTVQSLAIMFECGHCPKGMFGVLLHYILTHQKKLNWNLDISTIFRDQVSFEIGPYDDVVTIKFHTTHLEVMCYPTDVTQRSENFTLKIICNLICCMLVSGIEDAIKSLHYSRAKTKHSLGLVCTDCKKGHQVTEVNSQYMMRCRQQGVGYCPIPDPGSYWFGGEIIIMITLINKIMVILCCSSSTSVIP